MSRPGLISILFIIFWSQSVLAQKMETTQGLFMTHSLVVINMILR